MTPENTEPMPELKSGPNYHRNALLMIGGVLLIRLVFLLMSPLGLHGDEAQYWAWSKELDWGYFTKPPMIAWVIAVTTTLFGDAEWAVRASSAPLHAVTSYVIFRTGRALFDARTGFWAAAIYLLMPALWLSSLIVSTDVPLLLCFAMALNAWVHLRCSGPHWGRALQLGTAIGLGMLSKYAMLFFLPALGLCIAFDRPTRRALLNVRGLVALVLMIAIITPNIIWNVNHDFATLSHTADNANLGQSIPFHPLELLTFIATQFGVFGPISFLVLLIAIIYAVRGTLGKRAKWLSLFCISPLLIISLEALLSRANANWAITAYVAGPILLGHAALMMGSKTRNWIRAGLIFQTGIALLVVSAVMSPSLTNQLPLLPNSVKRLRMWPATAAALQEVIAKGHDGIAFESLATDKRIIFYDLRYYGIEKTLPLRMWMLHSAPANHAELTAPLAAAQGPVLVVHYDDNHTQALKDDFASLISLPPIDIDLGGGKRRQLKLWAGYGYTPTQTR